MKALTYQSSNKVTVENVPEPKLKKADDIIIKITATAICGSDLHIFRGKVPEMKAGDILGHEFMGIVEEVGSAVTQLKVGDKVVIPFVIACGHCFFCEKSLYSACEKTNPNEGGGQNNKNQKSGAAMFGYSHMYGGIPGGQAEYARVPNANVGPLKITSKLADEKVLFLSDILPTAYQAILNAEVKEGDTIAIFGAGPVGLLTAACAKMLNLSKIFMIDHHEYRLEFAQKTYNVIPINFDKQDPAEFINEYTHNRGVDAVVDAVGFEAKGSVADSVMTALKIESSSGAALKQCIATVRRGGVVSVPGVYSGSINGFLFGDAFDKGLTFKMGQTQVQKFMPELLTFIEKGFLAPEIIITHILNLDEAEKGYQIFNEKKESCRKVILKPQ